MYTAQRIEYSGGVFFGNENSEPTRTLLSFFISSVCGSYEDLVCFIPVTTLTAQKLLDHFMVVGQALEETGFEILPVLSDGHRTNVRFYKELLGGPVGTSLPSPFSSHHPIFLLFDPVHLMKNIFNNFQKRRFA